MSINKTILEYEDMCDLNFNDFNFKLGVDFSCYLVTRWIKK